MLAGEIDTPAKRYRLRSRKNPYWLGISGGRGGLSLGFRRTSKVRAYGSPKSLSTAAASIRRLGQSAGSNQDGEGRRNQQGLLHDILSSMFGLAPEIRIQLLSGCAVPSR
jgi:hypothetical protein